jgi:CHAT domain-containing protein
VLALKLLIRRIKHSRSREDALSILGEIPESDGPLTLRFLEEELMRSRSLGFMNTAVRIGFAIRAMRSIGTVASEMSFDRDTRINFHEIQVGRQLLALNDELFKQLSFTGLSFYATELSNMGEQLAKKRQFRPALERFYMAVALLFAMEEEREEALVWLRLSAVYRSMDSLVQATNAADVAASLAATIDVDLAFAARATSAALWVRHGDMETPLSVLEETYEHWRSQGNIRSQIVDGSALLPIYMYFRDVAAAKRLVQELDSIVNPLQRADPLHGHVALARIEYAKLCGNRAEAQEEIANARQQPWANDVRESLDSLEERLWEPNKSAVGTSNASRSERLLGSDEESPGRDRQPANPVRTLQARLTALRMEMDRRSRVDQWPFSLFELRGEIQSLRDGFISSGDVSALIQLLEHTRSRSISFLGLRSRGVALTSTHFETVGVDQLIRMVAAAGDVALVWPLVCDHELRVIVMAPHRDGPQLSEPAPVGSSELDALLQHVDKDVGQWLQAHAEWVLASDGKAQVPFVRWTKSPRELKDFKSLLAQDEIDLGAVGKRWRNCLDQMGRRSTPPQTGLRPALDLWRALQNVPDVPPRALMTAFRTWQESMRVGSEMLGRTLGAILGSTLPAQVTKVVLISPGKLGEYPFLATLHSAAGKPVQQIDLYEVSVVPSATLWAADFARRESFAQAPSAATIVVNPEGNLPLAEVEVDLLVTATRKDGGSQVIRGRDAELETVMAALPGRELIHFGCHGGLEGVRWRTGLHLARGEKLDIQTALWSTDLRSCRLAVLGACETSTLLPSLVHLDDEAGIAQAMLAAGARGVIGTRWFVGDEPTMLLLHLMYKHLFTPGTLPAAALRAAQLALRDLTTSAAIAIVDTMLAGAECGQSAGVALRRLRGTLRGATAQRPYADPYYWAGFVYFGV